MNRSMVTTSVLRTHLFSRIKTFILENHLVVSSSQTPGCSALWTPTELVHLWNCFCSSCWFQPLGLEPAACLQSRLCSGMHRRGNHPAELLFPCVASMTAAAVVVTRRSKARQTSAANQEVKKEGPSKQRGNTAAGRECVCVGGHTL